MKQIIWRVELVCAAILLICAAVWGFQPGVWNGSTFYRMETQEQGRSYTHSDKATVEVIDGAEESRLRVLSPGGQCVEILTLSLSENGSYKTVHMASEGGTWNATYNTGTGAFVGDGENDGSINKAYSISERVYERTGFSLGLPDATLYSMALGNESGRIAGRMGEFLLAALFLALGLSFRFLLGPMIRLDTFLAGFFYKGEDSGALRATQLSRTILSLLGLVIFAIGAVLWCSILFA